MASYIPVYQLVQLCSRYVKGWLRKLVFYIKSCFFDTRYKCITIDELEQLLKIWRENILPKLRYQLDFWDCDDFAMYFASWLKLKTKTNCGGMVIGVLNGFGHAWTPVLVKNYDDVDVMFVEPQLGRIVEVNKEDVIEMPVTVRRRMSVSGYATYHPLYYIW